MSMEKNIEMYRKHLMKYLDDGWSEDKMEWKDKDYKRFMDIYARYNMFFFDIIRTYYDGVAFDENVRGALEQLANDIMFEIDNEKINEITDEEDKEWYEIMQKDLKKTGADFS